MKECHKDTFIVWEVGSRITFWEWGLGLRLRDKQEAALL